MRNLVATQTNSGFTFVHRACVKIDYADARSLYQYGSKSENTESLTLTSYVLKPGIETSHKNVDK